MRGRRLLLGAATTRAVGALVVALARAGGAAVEVRDDGGAPLRVVWGGRLRLHARGGTTWGDAFVTGARPAAGARASADLMAHELVHVAQWRRWGWAFPLLYAAAELAPPRGPHHNRFEVAAGLQRGGYR